MEIVDQSVELMYLNANSAIEVYKKLEDIARICYQSFDKKTDDSYIKLLDHIMANGHNGILEHHQITLRIITDRGMSHEFVRHRMASYAQESTRYCNYKQKGLVFIQPHGIELDTLALWFLNIVEKLYNMAITAGIPPQFARWVLPMCLKTEFAVTKNISAWKHFISVRSKKGVHPQMIELTKMIEEILHRELPLLFPIEEDK